MEVKQRLWYYPFGMQMEGIGQAIAVPFQSYRYNGKELDQATGLLEYGARYHAPEIGRFTGVDPIADQFAWVSPFNYAENQVPNAIDLWGLQSVRITDNKPIPETQETGTEIRVTDPTGPLNIDYYDTTEDGNVFVSNSNEYRNETEQSVANRILGTQTDGNPDIWVAAQFITSISSPKPEPAVTAGVPIPPPPPPSGNAFTPNSNALTGGENAFINSVVTTLNRDPSLQVTIWAETNLPQFSSPGIPTTVGSIANPATLNGVVFPINRVTTQQLLMARGQSMQQQLINAGIDPSRIVFALQYDTNARIRIVYRRP